ncbi:sodium:proton antiporter [Aestuariicella hydrocarbonica]|uniref:Sodium:proton antiporter n=1 Tax=Pseudomaricurvus hydrocarbonicus TaxID=1470433 RepID=A0A9E5MQC5_9GAMM|nr:Na+/H+ antiporter NhaC family protein [Aestuariicella hydrocarbonica]NHO68563.1 sodium:proton antiporter [Aestuariicella hydrocarbonica]
MEPFGNAWALLPTALVFVLAVWTRRPIESLISGSLLGLIMLHGTGFVTGFAETSLRVMTDEDVAWVILVCGFMGSLIGLLIRTGAATAFTVKLGHKIRSQTSALFFTWGLGILMFVDDYLNSLAVGAAMRNLTDKYRISREKLAYVVDSTAAPVSVIIPFSTWGAFFGGLLVDNGLAEDGQGLSVYMSAIPYMLYAWVALFLVPIVIKGWVPNLGPMKAAELRAQETGVTVPPEAAHIEKANQAIQPKAGAKPRLWLFVLPMLSLVGLTMWFDNDFLIGIYMTLGLTLLAILLMRILDLHETFDTVIDGFKTMIEPLAVLIAAFILKDVNDALGLSTYVVDTMQPLLTPESLPAVIFISMGLVSFMTGSNWGVFVIVLPIVTSLGQTLGADMTLVIGATLSASTFGSHACFYSDATVLTAQATGCTPLQHALTQFPYALLAAIITLIGYLAIAYL